MLVVVLLFGLIITVNAQAPAEIVASQPVIVGADNFPIGCGDLYHCAYVKERVFIQSTITSYFAPQSFVYILKITDSDGVTVFLSWVKSKLGKDEQTKMTQGWTPDREGRYKIETFVWESLEKPVALSHERTVNVDVAVPFSVGLPTEDFGIGIAPTVIDLPERGSANVTVTLWNVRGVNGSQVDLASEDSCKCLQATFNPTTVTLPRYAAEVHSILTVRATHWSPNVQVYLTVDALAKLPHYSLGQTAKLTIVMRE